MKKVWYILLSLIIFIPLSLGDILFFFNKSPYEMNCFSNITSHYYPLMTQEHSPFNITCDEDFIIQAWPGQGTKESPYLIQGYTISTTGTCLGVINTTKHFIINECIFLSQDEETQSGNGILFSNVSNGIILNNFIFRKHIGMFLSNISHCTITNNKIENCSLVAVHADTLNDCALINNRLYCQTSWNALYLYGGINCNIANNTIIGFSKFGSFGMAVVKSNHTHIIFNRVTNFDYGLQISGYFLWLSNNEIYECNNGISVFNSGNCWLELNWIINGSKGVEIHDSNNCTLIWSFVAENHYGITLYGAYACSIIENYIIDNMWGLSFRQGYRGGSSGCSITDNEFQNNGVVFEIAAESEWDHIFRGNTVNRKLLGYFSGVSNIELDGDNYGQIIFVNCRNITLIGGNFHNSSVGLTLAFCKGCKLSDIVSNRNTYGILIKHSYNCSILYCEIKLNTIGVRLVSIRTSQINSNQINNNTIGLEIIDSWFNLITHNTLCYNSGIGIALSEGTIENSIYKNNIGWNRQNALDNGLNNTWDNGAGVGNSWSDYDGAGVYYIFGMAHAKDNYPLLLTYTTSYSPYMLLLILPFGILAWISTHLLTKIKSISGYNENKIKVPLSYVILSKLKRQKDTIRNSSKFEDEPES